VGVGKVFWGVDRGCCGGGYRLLWKLVGGQGFFVGVFSGGG